MGGHRHAPRAAAHRHHPQARRGPQARRHRRGDGQERGRHQAARAPRHDRPARAPRRSPRSIAGRSDGGHPLDRPRDRGHPRRRPGAHRARPSGPRRPARAAAGPPLRGGAARPADARGARRRWAPPPSRERAAAARPRTIRTRRDRLVAALAALRLGGRRVGAALVAAAVFTRGQDARAGPPGDRLVGGRRLPCGEPEQRRSRSPSTSRWTTPRLSPACTSVRRPR